MATIVTGMEMPESCSECPICHCKGKDDPWNYYCSATMNDINVQEWDLTRYNNCPLKSVEGLIEKIEQAKSNPLNQSPYFDNGLIKAMEIIKEYCGMEESNGNQD